VLYWRGFVVADLYSESFTSPPYEVSIKAVDGFNLLSNVQLLDTDFTQGHAANSRFFHENTSSFLRNKLDFCIFAEKPEDDNFKRHKEHHPVLP
ncbi:MAG: hypothetical protein ACI4UJ_05780, partial [Candidatus Cryptobacteroides sp.]